MKKRIVLTVFLLLTATVTYAAGYHTYNLICERWFNNSIPAECKLFNSHVTMDNKLILVHDCQGWIMTREFIPGYGG